MSNYKPKFSIKKRPFLEFPPRRVTEYGTSLWVTMPNGSKYNIWDVSKKSKLTEEILNCISAAFSRGYEARQMEIVSTVCKPLMPSCIKVEWKEEEAEE